MKNATEPLLSEGSKPTSGASAVFFGRQGPSNTPPPVASVASEKAKGVLSATRFRRFLTEPATFMNMPRVALHNRFLARLYRKPVHWLLMTSLVMFLIAALPFALIFYFTKCGDPDDADPNDPPATFLRVLAVAFSGLAGMDIGDDLNSATGCVVVIGLSQFVHILLEGDFCN